MSLTVAGLWNWSYSKGEFPVNFCSNSEFVCEQYPAHAHWNATEANKVVVSWGKYGTYDMTVSADGKSMEGCYRGYPNEWRKAVFIREHSVEERAKFAHDMAHNHAHDHDHSTCGHHHHH